MVLVALTLLLLAGIVAYFVGAYRLAKYGFRLSTGVGLAVLLFPPFTFFFAFKKLEVDGKELPTAMCTFGLVLIGLMLGAFYQPLGAMAVGDFERAHNMLHAEILVETEITDEEILALIAAGKRDEIAGDQEVMERVEELEEEGLVEEEPVDEPDDTDDEDESDDESDDEDGDEEE